MRVGRERLVETLQQMLIQNDHPEDEFYIGLDYQSAIKPYRAVSEEYADIIIDDMRLGFIGAET